MVTHLTDSYDVPHLTTPTLLEHTSDPYWVPEHTYYNS